MSTLLEVEQYLIDEINELEAPKFSVLNDKPCKHCGNPHKWITVECGIPVYWYFGEKPAMEGTYVEPPEGAIYFGDWLRKQWSK